MTTNQKQVAEYPFLILVGFNSLRKPKPNYQIPYKCIKSNQKKEKKKEIEAILRNQKKREKRKVLNTYLKRQ